MVNKKAKIAIGILIAAIALSGYTAGVIHLTKSHVLNELNIIDNKKDEILGMMNADDPITEIEKEFEKYSDKFTKEENSSIIDTIIYFTKNNAPKFDMGEASLKIYNEALDGIYVNKEKVTDETILDSLNNLELNHLCLMKKGEIFVVDVNYDYYIDKYKNDVTPGYFDILNFFKEESEIPYVDRKAGNLDIEVLEDRIDNLYIIANKEENEDVYNLSNSIKHFYEEIYLTSIDDTYGLNEGYIKDELFDSYSHHKFKDEELNKMLVNLVKAYESTEHRKTPEILKIINAYLGYEPIEETESNTEETLSGNDEISSDNENESVKEEIVENENEENKIDSTKNE